MLPELLDTSEKTVSLIGGAITIAAALGYGVHKKSQSQKQSQNQSQSQSQSQNQNQNQNQVQIQQVIINEPSEKVISIEEAKKTKKILFIDDDKTFKIVSILKRMDWKHVKIIKDINNLEDFNVRDADVLFVDIQGVGQLLQTKDEGLGLAMELKARYKESKKIIIYSAQTEGERFHDALRIADDFLKKNADPMQFENSILKVLGIKL